MTIFTTKNLLAAKILALFTAVMMIMSLLPMQAWAQEEAPVVEQTPAEDATKKAKTESDTTEESKKLDKNGDEELPAADEQDLSAARFVIPEIPKVVICHATGNEADPFNRLEIALPAIIGHLQHEDDIFPSYGLYDGRNLDTVYAEFDGATGQEIFDNDCAIPEPEKVEETIVITGDMNNWLFNRDLTTVTPFAFNTSESSIGIGSLEVFPIGANAFDKMVAEYFANLPVNTLESISYDFLIGGDGAEVDENQFYLNVYANIDDTDNYYDCRFDYVPTNGSVGDFSTATFDATDTPVNVVKRGSRIANCPTTLAGMPAGSYVHFMSLNLGDKSTSDVGLGGNFDKVVLDTTTKITTFDFEPKKTTPPPACDLGAETVADTTFDTFNLGNVNAQNGWSSTGAFDQEVVTNTYGFTTFGCKSLRISNAVTQSSFGNQTFAAPFADRVGEVDSTDGAFAGGVKFNRYEAQFDIASTKPTEQQSGLAISVSPDRGDGSRMSHLSFVDSTSTIAVNFTEVQGVDDASIDFAATHIAGLTRTEPHTIKIVVETNDGADNDVVMIYIDGSLVHTGKSWENYYRFDNESVAEQSPRVIKTLLFRTAGTAAPANDGNGFLFDNMSLKAMNQPEEPTNSVKVHIFKHLKAGQVTAQIPNDSTAPNFPMTSSWSATNVGTGSGSYVLGNSEGGTTLRYAADTSFMAAPADYTTSEVTGVDSVVLAADAKCVPGKYRLVGYKQGDTLEAAESALISTTAPVYTDITTDKYVIVVNEMCAKAVTCAIGENLIQNGSFETEIVNDNGGTWQIFSTIAGWMHSLSSGLEIWNNFNGTGAGLASDGEQNAELDGDDATRITQPVTLVPGATYELSFDYSPRAQTALADSAMDALIDGNAVMTLNTDGSANTANAWTSHSVTFVATTTSAVVGFEDKGTPNDGGGYGPLLDNVAVCMVEEPEPLPTCTLTIKSDATDYVVEKNAVAKVLATPYHELWITSIPASSATWIWGDMTVTNPMIDETQTFEKGFVWTGGVASATLKVASDNSNAITLGSFSDGDVNEDNYSSFKTYDVSAGVVPGANTLSIAVKNFGMVGGNTEMNPAGLMYELTITGTGESCGTVDPIDPIDPVEPEPMVTLNASKVVCDSADAMPNGTPANPITAATAQAWVDQSDGACRLVSGWDFEWGAAGAGNGGDAILGNAANYTEFGPTNASGLASVQIPLANLGGRIEAREVLQSGYIPFSNDLGAEFYCHTDAAGTDNWDWVNNPVDGGTYHCVAFNMETPDDGDDTDPEIYTLDGYKYPCYNNNEDSYYCEEGGYAGWTIYATNGEDELSTTTDATGYYYFEVESGDWAVSEDQSQYGWTQLLVEENNEDIDASMCEFAVGDNADWATRLSEIIWEPEYRCDFHNLYNDDDDNNPDTYRVIGQKWNDIDGDGEKEEGEAGLSGWTIYADRNDDEQGPISTLTDTNGNYFFDLVAGNWEIYEEDRANWNQTAVTQNGDDVITDGEILTCNFTFGELSLRTVVAPTDIVYVENNCTFFNQLQEVEEEPETPRRSGGGGSGTRVTNRATPQGLVLGAATTTPMCGMYLEDYMRMGNAASSTQVIKLQIFLNAVGIELAITGTFDAATDAAVRTFQMQYKPEVLTPWYTAGIVPHNNPTGWVYQLTRWKINNIVCPGSEAYPVLS